MTQQSELAIHVPVEVLAPTIDITNLLVKAAASEELFKAVFISTNRHSEYTRWLDELRAFKHCGRAIEPRQVGKSRSSAQYRDEHIKQVSHVEAWTNLSSQRLFSQILKDIKHAAWRGKRQDLRPRLAESLKLFGSQAAGIGGIIARWEKLYFNPFPTEEELGSIASLVGLDLSGFQAMLPSRERTFQPRPIRLCGACYDEVPCHRMEWQYKDAVAACQHHNLRLLERCPQCKKLFEIPALWNTDRCHHCQMRFTSMAKYQERIKEAKGFISLSPPVSLNNEEFGIDTAI